MHIFAKTSHYLANVIESDFPDTFECHILSDVTGTEAGIVSGTIVGTLRLDEGTWGVTDCDASFNVEAFIDTIDERLSSIAEMMSYSLFSQSVITLDEEQRSRVRYAEIIHAASPIEIMPTDYVIPTNASATKEQIRSSNGMIFVPEQSVLLTDDAGKELLESAHTMTERAQLLAFQSTYIELLEVQHDDKKRYLISSRHLAEFEFDVSVAQNAPYNELNYFLFETQSDAVAGMMRMFELHHELSEVTD